MQHLLGLEINQGILLPSLEPKLPLMDFLWNLQASIHTNTYMYTHVHILLRFSMLFPTHSVKHLSSRMALKWPLGEIYWQEFKMTQPLWVTIRHFLREPNKLIT